MPPIKKSNEPEKKPTGKRKHHKQPTQRTPMQRVMVMGHTGKLRMEWRPWN